jgi:hypothetical protein
MDIFRLEQNLNLRKSLSSSVFLEDERNLWIDPSFLAGKSANINQDLKNLLRADIGYFPLLSSLFKNFNLNNKR